MSEFAQFVIVACSVFVVAILWQIHDRIVDLLKILTKSKEGK